MSLAIVVLAAGRGTRMVSSKPKVLHPIAGVPMVFHAMRAASALHPERSVVVAGYGAEQVSKAVENHAPNAEIVIQKEQLGTAHAVDQARDSLADFEGDVIVLFGDTPFIKSDTLRGMLDARRAGADVVVLGFEAADPGRYGRLILKDGRLQRIVEAKDASPQELEINLCNSGVICSSRKTLFDLISRIGCGNAAQEYYLTDIVEKANDAGLACSVVTCAEEETLGINSRVELARAEAIFQNRARAAAMAEGVTLVAPETVFFCAGHPAGAGCSGGTTCGVRAGGRGRGGGSCARLLASGGLPGWPCGRDWALCPSSTRELHWRGRQGRQFRRDQERNPGGRRQGQSPELFGRCPCRGGGQYRGRYHHLQL